MAAIDQPRDPQSSAPNAKPSKAWNVVRVPPFSWQIVEVSGVALVGAVASNLRNNDYREPFAACGGNCREAPRHSSPSTTPSAD